MRDSTIAWLTDRVRSYRQTFNPNVPANRIVLADLARFCRAGEVPAVMGDTLRTERLLGRYEVWLRVQQHIHLTPEQLFALLSDPVQTTEGKAQ